MSRFPLLISIFAVSALFSDPFTAQAQTVEFLTEPRAMSVMVVKIELADVKGKVLDLLGPNDSEFENVQLLSREDAFLGSKSRYFTQSGGSGKILIIPFFTSAVKSWDNAKHSFPFAGEYTFRLKGYTYDEKGKGFPPTEHVLFRDDIQFARASEADLQYFALANEEKVYRLFGLDPRHAREILETSDKIMGIALMQHIILMTLSRTPGEDERGEAANLGETLYEFAFAIPESSYAPYLAYDAACCLFGKMTSVNPKTRFGYEFPNQRFAELEDYKKARKALEFAVQRGDPYIKPLAMCFLAGCKGVVEDFTGAESLLKQAKEQSPGVSGMRRMIPSLERTLPRLKAKLLRRARKDGHSTSTPKP